MSNDISYGFQTSIDATFDETIERVTNALKNKGFGILTEINMQKTLKQKLDIDTNRYMIFGACNPNLAHQALQEEQTIGLLLPCNVIVYEDQDRLQTHIAILDPLIMMQVTDNPALKAIADDANTRLQHVIENI